VDPGSVDCPGFIFVADNAVSALSLIGQDERRNEMPRPGATVGRGFIGCEWLLVAHSHRMARDGQMNSR
jgi:hypothetical protein